MLLQEAGVRLVYDCKGAIVSTATCPRAVGTTVAIGELFKPLPVRHRVGVLAVSESIKLRQQIPNPTANAFATLSALISF